MRSSTRRVSWWLGNGGTHLFLASVLLTAVSVVLVLEANVESDRERNVMKATQRGATWPALNTVLIAVSNGWRRAPEWHPVVRARPGSAIT